MSPGTSTDRTQSRFADMQVRVVGPDAPAPSPAELRRLFRDQPLTASRRERLSSGGRVLAHSGGRVVGLAAYLRLDAEVRVDEFGVDDEAPCGTAVIVDALLDALEVACLAGGGRRLVVRPRGFVADRYMANRGFRALGGGAAGHHFEKTFPV